MPDQNLPLTHDSTVDALAALTLDPAFGLPSNVAWTAEQRATLSRLRGAMEPNHV